MAAIVSRNGRPPDPGRPRSRNDTGGFPQFFAIALVRTAHDSHAVAAFDAGAVDRKSLTELQAELDPANVWQIHRSTVVNANAIAGVARDLRGRMSVTLKQRSECLSVSESHQHLFKPM